MNLDESDKAMVRQFLATNAASRWIEYVAKSVPKLDLNKVDTKAYNISLYQKEGWNNALEFLRQCVHEDQIQEYGVRPIDTVSD